MRPSPFPVFCIVSPLFLRSCRGLFVGLRPPSLTLSPSQSSLNSVFCVVALGVFPCSHRGSPPPFRCALSSLLLRIYASRFVLRLPHNALRAGPSIRPARSSFLVFIAFLSFLRRLALCAPSPPPLCRIILLPPLPVLLSSLLGFGHGLVPLLGSGGAFCSSWPAALVYFSRSSFVFFVAAFSACFSRLSLARLPLRGSAILSRTPSSSLFVSVCLFPFHDVSLLHLCPLRSSSMGFRGCPFLALSSDRV